jgi:hypothetical protein
VGTNASTAGEVGAEVTTITIKTNNLMMAGKEAVVVMTIESNVMEGMMAMAPSREVAEMTGTEVEDRAGVMEMNHLDTTTVGKTKAMEGTLVEVVMATKVGTDAAKTKAMAATLVVEDMVAILAEADTAMKVVTDAATTKAMVATLVVEDMAAIPAVAEAMVADLPTSTRTR